MALRAAVYAAAIVAGYAAGATLLLWRADAGSKLQAAIDQGVVGVEQLNPMRYWAWGHTGVFAYSNIEYFHMPHELRNISGWLVLCAGMWLAVFVSLGIVCLASTRIAPRAIRLAAGGADGALVKEIWRSTLRKSVSILREPFILSTAFLIGLAIIVLCDVASLLSRSPHQFFGNSMVLTIEVAPLLCMAIVVPAVLVRMAAARRAKFDPELIRRWCGRCGHSLDPNSGEHPETTRCPECRHHKPSTLDGPRTRTRTRQAFITFVLLAVFALLIATHHWTRTIGMFVVDAIQPDAYERNYDDIVVKAGSVVRVERPNGTIWLRVDRLGPQALWNWRGPGKRPHPDARLRIVADLDVVSSSRGDGTSSGWAMKRSRMSRVLDDQDKLNSGGSIEGITIDKDGKGTPLELLPEWYSGRDVVTIYLSPRGATSIQAVDPATAPSFDDDK